MAFESNLIFVDNATNYFLGPPPSQPLLSGEDATDGSSSDLNNCVELVPNPPSVNKHATRSQSVKYADTCPQLRDKVVSSPQSTVASESTVHPGERGEPGLSPQSGDMSIQIHDTNGTAQWKCPTCPACPKLNPICVRITGM